VTTLTGHVLRTPQLSRPSRSDRGRPEVRTQFLIRSDDRVVRVCCSDRVADYAVRFLQPGDRIRAIGTMSERTWTTASGDQASALRLYAEDITTIREADE